MNFATDTALLFLIFSANSAPILAAHVFPGRLNGPIDGGRHWPDKRALLGESKTWRGLVGGVLLPAVLAPLVGWSGEFGFLLGMSAMLGDLCSSFVKRRITLDPEARATGLDQIPESLFPTLTAMHFLSIDWRDLILIPLAFMAIEIMISPLLYRLKLRNRPY